MATSSPPGSKTLGDKLVAEEKRLADLEAQLQTVTTARPKVLPHPAAIAKYVSELANTLESQDRGAAGAVLRRALAPFRMEPEGTGCRMTGALDVSVCSEVVAGA